MICPSCGRHIPDKSRVCPACQASMSRLADAHAPQHVYCKGCGSLVPQGDTWCPRCGLQVVDLSETSPENTRSVQDIDARLADPASNELSFSPAQEETQKEAQEEAKELEDTNVIPRLETALPGNPAETDEPGGRMLNTRSIVVAAIAALLIVGGITLVITHPWDPQAFSTSATTPADTSQAGYPGTLDSLSAQDKSAESESDETEVELTAEESSYQSFYGMWESLADLRDQIVANEEELEELGFSGTDDEVQAAAYEATLISIELSNLIDSIREVDTVDGTYTQTQEALLNLGNWLRNYSDNICSAWSAILESSDPASDRSSIEAILNAERNADGRNTYLVLFEANYDAAEPQAS